MKKMLRTPQSPMKTKRLAKTNDLSLESVSLTKLKASILMEYPDSHVLWNKPVKVKENTIVCGNFITGDIIREGSYAIVYECLNDYKQCIKLEKATSDVEILDQQMDFHKKIALAGYAPTVYAHDQISK